jgi:hypothetical protein
VAPYEDLFLAAHLGAHIGSLRAVGLHRCGPPEGSKTNANTHGPEDVMRKLGFAKTLVLRVGDMLTEGRQI